MSSNKQANSNTDDSDMSRFAPPPMRFKPPYIGFQHHELTGCHVWLHVSSIIDVTQFIQGETLITYHDGQVSRTVRSLCSLENVEDGIGYVRQEIEPLGFEQMPEARAWLSDRSAPGDLAANRFKEGEGLLFVERLYERRAEDVRIGNASASLHTDTLFVKMPADHERALKLLAFLAQEVENGGCVMRETNEPHVFLLWWD